MPIENHDIKNEPVNPIIAKARIGLEEALKYNHSAAALEQLAILLTDPESAEKEMQFNDSRKFVEMVMEGLTSIKKAPPETFARQPDGQKELIQIDKLIAMIAADKFKITSNNALVWKHVSRYLKAAGSFKGRYPR